MLTIEDRILRIELLTGIISVIPEQMLDKKRMKQLRDEHGLMAARSLYIKEYFEKKENEFCPLPPGEPYEGR